MSELKIPWEHNNHNNQPHVTIGYPLSGFSRIISSKEAWALLYCLSNVVKERGTRLLQNHWHQQKIPLLTQVICRFWLRITDPLVQLPNDAICTSRDPSYPTPCVKTCSMLYDLRPKNGLSYCDNNIGLCCFLNSTNGDAHP